MADGYEDVGGTSGGVVLYGFVGFAMDWGQKIWGNSTFMIVSQPSLSGKSLKMNMGSLHGVGNKTSV